MKLEMLYIVRDPGPSSDLGDIVFKLPASKLADYIYGCGPGVWQRERHTIYTEIGEALVDGEARLRARAPS